MAPQRVHIKKALDSLPDVWPADLRPQIKHLVESDGRKIVVLDDDPTGTQTVYGLPVLTRWSVEMLQAELGKDYPAFYVLTNSRSVRLSEAFRITAEVGRHLFEASRRSKCRFVIVSRSDSTLRGHFPGEMDSLTKVQGKPFDGWLLVPFFLEGGRMTIDNVHYVKQGQWLVPAAETEFARDCAFGYTSSDLRLWVQEKTKGRVAADDVISISIDTVRKKGPQAVTHQLMQVSDGKVVVVNAASYRDLEVFAIGLLAAEAKGKVFLYRTAASFVQVRAGLRPRDLLSRHELRLPSSGGGLVVVGSHVPQTTKQVDTLLRRSRIHNVEVNAAALINKSHRTSEVDRIARIVNEALKRNAEIVIYTSRHILSGQTTEISLNISRSISEGLTEIIERIAVTPRYIIAKGGITSSDVATRGLNVSRAMVIGQIAPGVPVWRLGDESRFPGLAYIVFPGNVGDANALQDVIVKLDQR